MKKNLISVLILALVFANFVLTAILMFTVLPETQKANTLIEKVCSAIDLDLNSGGTNGTSSIPIDQQDTYKVNEGEKITTNLAKGNDGKSSGWRNDRQDGGQYQGIPSGRRKGSEDVPF